ncbi:MAG: ATP-binding protein [Rickettsiales bacterium]|nr:ATP-binding protein [Rickettsiales bacterium]
MSVSIRKIEIENFRSIRRVSVETKKMNVFVGQNDCGKSNVLRSLNLFFNEETNAGQSLIFSDDFNFNYEPPARKAKEIIVKLELDIPSSYRSTNGDFIVWEKIWRANGKFKDEYYGIRLVPGRRGGTKKEIIEIPQKSNVHSLLKKTEYQYIPAIKDSYFFSDLRGKIYGIISEVAKDTFKESSSDFETAIGQHLQDLTQDINSSLGFSTKLALPRDLSHIFQNLDFLSGDKSVSLDNRGDGIKARHIPIILKFMAEKKRLLQVRGAMPYSFIWGYEEPENNLEFSNSIKLADEFVNYANNDVAQIFLTTHSPVFYNLGSSADVSPYHVIYDPQSSGTELKKEPSDLDDRMGMMALITPHLAPYIKQIKDLEEAKKEVEQQVDDNRHHIFVEGESDQIILQKALKVFFPNIDNIAFTSKASGAGHQYVKDMLTAWHAKKKHDPTIPKAAGIVDSDAKKIRADWNAAPNHTDSCKCFEYKTPTWLRSLKSEGYNIPITLETQYPESAWKYAQDNNYLVDRAQSKILPNAIVNQLTSSAQSLSDILSQTDLLYVLYDFNGKEYKKKMAKHISRKSPQEATSFLQSLKPLLEEIINYLKD